MVTTADHSQVFVSGASLKEISEPFDCPPDKSFTHRAIIFAAIAAGHSKIQGPLMGEDCISTIETFRKLGVRITDNRVADPAKVELVIESPGIFGWDLHEDLEFDFGNSGTTARLLLGLFTGVSGLRAICRGDESLQSRPMGRVTNLLKIMGAEFSGSADYLPINIEGRDLTPKLLSYDKASAQVKSALLFASFNCQGVQEIHLPAGGRDHTEKFIKALGGQISTSVSKQLEVIKFKGPFQGKTLDCVVPGDPSSAAFIFALHYFSGNQNCVIRHVMDNPTRTGFFKILKKMGVKIEVSPFNDKEEYIEKTVDLNLTIEGNLKATAVEAVDIPSMIDEVPILALIMSSVEGISRICGLEELRVKESDRLAETMRLIQLTGGQCEMEGDDLIIFGSSRKFTPFEYHSKGDHRMAMSAICAALAIKKPSVVNSIECIKVSFPNFFYILEKFVGGLRVRGEIQLNDAR